MQVNFFYFTTYTAYKISKHIRQLLNHACVIGPEHESLEGAHKAGNVAQGSVSICVLTATETCIVENLSSTAERA